MKNRFTLLIAFCFFTLSTFAQVVDVVTGLIGPSSLALSGDELYISERDANKISKINISETNPTATFVANATQSSAILLDGDIIYSVSYQSSNVYKIDLSQSTPTEEVLATGFSGPFSLALRGNELYVSEYDIDAISKIDITATNPQKEIVVNSGINGPYGLRFKNDDLYVADALNGRIIKIDVTASSPVAEVVATGFNFPAGLEVNGNFLYVSETLGAKISRINLLDEAPSPTTVVPSLNFPRLTAFNGVELYICEDNLGKIVKLDIDDLAFTTPGTICTNTMPDDLGGASPTGGVYSGSNVTDNGDGMTFTFDAAAAGAGTHTVTYTIGGNSVNSTLTVAESFTFTPLTDTLLAPGDSPCYILDPMVTGGSGDFSYSWTGGFSSSSLTICPFATGFFELVITDNVTGCTAVDTASYTYVEYAFTPPANVCDNAGVQSGIGGVTPPGGVFSGPGVTDDANGSTFSFDPAAAGTGTQTITYTISGNGSLSVDIEVFAAPTVTYTGPGTVGIGAGVQTLSGGMPTGGTYSGPGVTGTNFDPTIAGPGMHTITYSFTDANSCMGTASDVITVSAPTPGNICSEANDINPLFGQMLGEAQTSGLYDNTFYTSEASDPTTGFECFFNSDGLQRTIWYTFVGDGNTYNIKTVQCNATNYITDGDTQMAVYTGDDCGSLNPVACNEDEDEGAQIYNTSLDLLTEAGVTYYVLIDGLGIAVGEFCVQVTLSELTDVIDIVDTNIELFPNPTSGTLNLLNVEADEVEVYDQLGRIVKRFVEPGNNLDISNLSSGLYVVKIRVGEELYAAKVIKQ